MRVRSEWNRDADMNSWVKLGHGTSSMQNDTEGKDQLVTFAAHSSQWNSFCWLRYGVERIHLTPNLYSCLFAEKVPACLPGDLQCCWLSPWGLGTICIFIVSPIPSSAALTECQWKPLEFIHPNTHSPNNHYSSLSLNKPRTTQGGEKFIQACIMQKLFNNPSI